MMRLTVFAAHTHRERLPVVVLGGGYCPPQTWEAFARHLPGHPIYVLTMPTSDGRGVANLDDYLYAVDHTLASLSLSRVMVMGTGVNAEAALRYCLMKSSGIGFDAVDRVGALILSAVSGDKADLAERSNWLEDAISLMGSNRRIGSLLRDQLAARTLSHPGIETLITRWAGDANPAEAAWQLRAHSQRKDIRAALGSICVPVQLLHGCEERQVRRDQSEAVARSLCTIVHYVPQAAGLIQIDQPQRCAQAVTALAPFVRP